MRSTAYFIKTNIYIFQIFKNYYPYFLYRDQAYKLLINIFRPYTGNKLTTSNKQYINKELVTDLILLVLRLLREDT